MATYRTPASKSKSKTTRLLAATDSRSSRAGGLSILTSRSRKAGGVRKGTFKMIYSAQPLEKIEVIKAGVAPAALGVIADAMGARHEVVVRKLGIPKSTWARKRQQHSPLEKGASELVMGLATLIGQVESMLGEQAAPNGIEAGKWFYKWAEDPIPALGGKAPVELLDTKEGQQVVATLLGAIGAGTYL